MTSRIAISTMALIIAAGCSGEPQRTDNRPHDGRGPGDPSTQPPPTSDFRAAQPVDLGDGDQAAISGTVAFEGEVDVYDLGPLALGDRISVLAEAADPNQFDPMIALFDGSAFRAYWNDDIDPNGNFNAHFEGLVRHDSSHYYLAIASSNFAPTIGDYRMQVEVARGSGLEPIRGQTIVINWEGGRDMVVAGTSFGDAPPFDAAIIDPAFAGATEVLKQLVTEIVRQDYAPFEVEVLTTDDPQPAGRFTTVHFGLTSDLSIFGIADDVDFYNGRDDDNVILILASFANLSGSLEGIAQAIANVISHEVGHSLGLMHTADITSIMDTTGADVSLLEDQSFGVAEVHDFPIGLQNDPMLLGETVGVRSIALAKHHDAGGPLHCGTCGVTLAGVQGHSH